MIKKNFSYSNSSRTKIETCSENIKRVCYEVIKWVDATPIYGHRTPDEQFELFKQGRELQNGIWVVTNPLAKVTNCDGKNKLSKHNYNPSKAIDLSFYPIDWRDKEKFYWFGGIVLAIAGQLGVELVWGGDWDGDTDLHDQTLMDLVHFEEAK